MSGLRPQTKEGKTKQKAQLTLDFNPPTNTFLNSRFSENGQMMHCQASEFQCTSLIMLNF